MRRLLPALLAVLAACLAGCGRDDNRPEPKARPTPVRVFYASGFSAVIEAVRQDAAGQGFELQGEGSGSQLVCRKLSDLGRDCDLVVLADNELVAGMLTGVAAWRLDFATDEMVLAVGSRAPNAELAEKDWPAALQADGVKLGRANENTAPIGYRTMLVWKLEEKRGAAGLAEKLKTRCDKVVDDVGALVPLLKSGELDYAFVYRSTCIAQGLRFVSLAEAVNLGSTKADYSGAEVTFDKLKAGAKETVTVKGAPICWTITVPERSAQSKVGLKLTKWLLTEQGAALRKNGLRPITPTLYYGPGEPPAEIAGLCRRAGDLR